MMSKYYAYCTLPIDNGFNNLILLEDYVIRLANSAKSVPGEITDDFKAENQYSSVSSVLSLWEFGKSLAKKVGWEGDIREGPYVFFIPDPGSFEMRQCFVFKQDNNGETFIISPFEMPWLRDFGDSLSTASGEHE